MSGKGESQIIVEEDQRSRLLKVVKPQDSIAMMPPHPIRQLVGFKLRHGSDDHNEDIPVPRYVITHR